jgi:hypothetical protein
MKNFIGYIIPEPIIENGGKKLAKRLRSVTRSLKIQVENSLRLGWKKEDIVFVTNFEFEHMGVKAYINNDLIPTATRFLGKHYSLCWAMQRFDDDWWVHDHDTWQLRPFGLPEMKTDICAYKFWGKKVGDSSFFVKKEAKNIIKNFIDYTINEAERFKNRKGGEVYWYNFIIENKIPYDILDWAYALRRNKFEARYAAATKPIKAVHIKNKRTLLGFYCGQNPVNFQVSPEFVKIYRKY